MMNRHCTLPLALMVALSIPAGTVQAGAINIPNYSFETPVLDLPTPYTTTVAELLPWIGQWAAIYQAEKYYNAFGEGGVTPSDGVNAGYLNPGSAWRPYLYQTLGDTYVAGQDYTLTVAASTYQNPANAGQLLSIQLGYWEGDPNGDTGPTIMAERQITDSELTTWTMRDFSASTGPVSGDAVGKPIVIYIGRAAISEVGPQWDVDNVRLSSVPEPGTLILLAAGLLGLSARAAKRRTAGQPVTGRE